MNRLRAARQLLRLARDILAGDADKLPEETTDNLAVESRKLRAVLFRQGMKEPIGVLGEKKVYAIDGDEVKVKHTMDFVEGGNGMVYDFIPRDEIWVDARMEPQDWTHIAFHEAVESLLMEERGLGYDEAHAQANSLELGELQRTASAV